MLNRPQLNMSLTVLLLASPAFATTQEDYDTQKAMSPLQIRETVYKPWKGPLLDLKKDLKTDRSYVAWVLVPPHSPIDMRSGNLFKHFYLATPQQDFSISHNMILWQCRRKDGTRLEGGMAITGENDYQSKTMLKDGSGLSSLFANFTDGLIEGPEDVVDEINDEAKVQGHATVAFEVSDESCEYMLHFVDAFTLDPNRPYENFSDVKDPEKLEGGGCVTLAGALLRKAGILSNVWPHFNRNFLLNRQLLGGNIPLPPHVTVPEWSWLKGRPHSVPLLEVMALNWDGDQEDGEPLTLMDPEMMLYSLRTIALEYLKTVPAQYRAEEEKIFGRSPFGYRKVRSSVGPFISIKEQYIKSHQLFPINDAYDEQAAETSRDTKAWLAAELQSGMRMRHTKVKNSPGLIIDRP
ncbi:MAG: hypothetical protein ACXVCI_16890 [Bdellovibrionota bacterium]